jgi:hypothetical protein
MINKTDIRRRNQLKNGHLTIFFPLIRIISLSTGTRIIEKKSIGTKKTWSVTFLVEVYFNGKTRYVYFD